MGRSLVPVRFQTYSTAAGRDEERAFPWSSRFAAEWMPDLALIEVALRNLTHDSPRQWHRARQLVEPPDTRPQRQGAASTKQHSESRSNLANQHQDTSSQASALATG